MVKYFLILLLMVMACSSKKQLLKLNSVNDSLKLNSVYVNKISDEWNGFSFIYTNGIFKTHGGFKNGSDIHDSENLSDSSLNSEYRYKSDFGIIEVINDKVKIQLWPSGLRTPSVVEYGQVKSKTQFVINRLCQVNSFGDLYNCESRNDIYNFVELKNKPDSINPFIGE